MALGKLCVSFGGTLLMVLCFVHLSDQACDRPDISDPNIIIDPDQATYSTYFYFDASCADGYEKTNGPDRCYCQPPQFGDPDEWCSGIDTLECTELVTCSKPNYTDPDVTLDPDKTSYDRFDVVTVSCLSGFLQGADTLTCQTDGTWNPEPSPDSSSCLSDCSAPANSNGTGTYSHNSVVTFACNAGYGDTVITSTCNDGTFNPLVTCELQGCSEPSLPTDVIITDAPTAYDVYSKVTLACDGDTTLVGPSYSYCNETGQWDPDPLTIKCRNQCEVPSFDDSRLIHTSDLTGISGETFYDHTDTLRFSCDGSIFVDGPWKSVCNDGTWSPNIGGYRPVCRDNCTAPPNMSNAGETYLHSYSHTFECDSTPGLVRMGGPQSVCMDGVWKPRIRCDLKTNLRSEL